MGVSEEGEKGRNKRGEKRGKGIGGEYCGGVKDGSKGKGNKKRVRG